MIESIIDSPRKNKRFRIILENKKYFDFGLKGGQTFIDHKNTEKRENYRKRHLGNSIEKNLIENIIPSPALFSFWILWGDSSNLKTNVIELNKKLEK